ncbi:hypothetical protein D3C78_1318910 [compost metagenome]
MFQGVDQENVGKSRFKFSFLEDTAHEFDVGSDLFPGDTDELVGALNNRQVAESLGKQGGEGAHETAHFQGRAVSQPRAKAVEHVAS